MNDQEINVSSIFRERLLEIENDLIQPENVADVGSWHIDFSSNHIQWSPETYIIFGIAVGERISFSKFISCVYEDDRPDVILAWQKALDTGYFITEHRIQVAGQVKWVMEAAQLFTSREVKKGYTHAIGTVRDITQQKQFQLVLEQQKRQLDTALEAANAGTWELESEKRLMSFNRSCADMFSLTLRELNLLNLDGFVAMMDKQDATRFEKQITNYLSADRSNIDLELRLRANNSDWIWIRMLGRSGKKGLERNTATVSGIVMDITASKLHEQQLTYIQSHDTLTGLINRSWYLEFVKVEMQRAHHVGQILGIAYIDIDNLSGVNGSFGNKCGDALLHEFSLRLKKLFPKDQHVARLGGDEFAITLSGFNTAEECEKALETLYQSLDVPFIFEENSLQISISVGVSFYPQTLNIDSEQLLRQASQAMYQAKLKGKQRYLLFDPDLDQSIRARMSLLDEVSQAIDNGHMLLYYQPKVNMRTGKLLGFEALIRWQHPENGLIAPSQFISFVEGDPLAIRLGDWVIEAALMQLNTWQSIGFQTNVSVNVGSLQLHDAELVKRLEQHLSLHPEVLPEQLELEVLETGAIDDILVASTLINDAHRLGVRTALDDFGTGYSSLTFLKQLPTHTIKIDQSFVRDAIHDTEHTAIIEAVIDLSVRLRRSPLAEGIESEVHGRLLLEMGCEYGQGYFIARPMPVEDVPKWIEEWRLPHSWSGVGKCNELMMPLLMAEIEYRGWLMDIETFVRGNAHAMPEDLKKSDFYKWLNRTNYHQATYSGFHSVIKKRFLHIHSLAGKLYGLHKSGERTQAEQVLKVIQRESDGLLDLFWEYRDQKTVTND